jgi:hypothetical protein
VPNTPRALSFGDNPVSQARQAGKDKIGKILRDYLFLILSVDDIKL